MFNDGFSERFTWFFLNSITNKISLIIETELNLNLLHEKLFWKIQDQHVRYYSLTNKLRNSKFSVKFFYIFYLSCLLVCFPSSGAITQEINHFCTWTIQIIVGSCCTNILAVVCSTECCKFQAWYGCSHLEIFILVLPGGI